MLDKLKTDKELGIQIEEYLKKNKVNTPHKNYNDTDENKINQLIEYYTKILEILELDLSDDSLEGTPRRLAKMWLNELTWGMKPQNFPKCTTVENKMNYDEMVTVRDCSVMSQCEHHLVTIDGTCSVSYIPNKKVLGLSKINRIVEYFCRRPQIQERLTEQIWYALKYILETDNIAVQIKAVHYCVKSRGVADQNSSTVTTKMGGEFNKTETRMEFLNGVSK